MLRRNPCDKMGKKHNFSEVTGWIRARLVFATLRATNVCLLGPQTIWRSCTEFDHGA